MPFNLAYPDAEVWFTECTRITQFFNEPWGNLKAQGQNLLTGTIQYGAQSVILWNAVLQADENRFTGPTLGNVCTNCLAPVLILNNQTGEYKLTSDFSTLAMGSRATRRRGNDGPYTYNIGVNTTAGELLATGFETPLEDDATVKATTSKTHKRSTPKQGDDNAADGDGSLLGGLVGGLLGGNNQTNATKPPPDTGDPGEGIVVTPEPRPGTGNRPPPDNGPVKMSRYSLILFNQNDFWGTGRFEDVTAVIEFRGQYAQITVPVGVHTIWWTAPSSIQHTAKRDLNDGEGSSGNFLSDLLKNSLDSFASLTSAGLGAELQGQISNLARSFPGFGGQEELQTSQRRRRHAALARRRTAADKAAEAARRAESPLEARQPAEGSYKVNDDAARGALEAAAQLVAPFVPSIVSIPHVGKIPAPGRDLNERATGTGADFDPSPEHGASSPSGGGTIFGQSLDPRPYPGATNGKVAMNFDDTSPLAFFDEQTSNDGTWQLYPRPAKVNSPQFGKNNPMQAVDEAKSGAQTQQNKADAAGKSPKQADVVNKRPSKLQRQQSPQQVKA